ncbi:PASTA domain-containing protein [Oceanihabitans sediminis]|uniref:PASTA domain-containing protein n=1 Tax=Oceanihabitans sediminis TaxID=1812012 RepID=A0A368P615_9FLAO|nr:PASTA domain-containing protein [Oceanihabitans sediminis]MDX1278622.1 PASTA domain-containing protein [Oceanihabitans sediminis]MDX1774305.1 PASTA domain-containing protein [Oceanihabitans sediminis]RBP29893.1 PASTA domain-containing protein [Oceanihabitans sediminis]RCU57229.1 PASTA domain-containing protein [Oceanihabitans sediminis]
MSIVKFLVSKTFLKQLVLAVLAVVVISFLMLRWLSYTTNHGEFETVPDLKGKSIEVAEMELKENNLVMQIQDSANFNPDYPKFSVIEQDPAFGEKVKENRKIYITLNPSGYRKIQVPDLTERTFRQAKPMLEALGFEIGKITYVDYLGKDEVVRLSFKGEKLEAGELLPKTSKIDIVLGNGNRPDSN